MCDLIEFHFFLKITGMNYNTADDNFSYICKNAAKTIVLVRVTITVVKYDA